MKLKLYFFENASRDKLKDHLVICLVSKDELLTGPGSKVVMVRVVTYEYVRIGLSGTLIAKSIEFPASSRI